MMKAISFLLLFAFLSPSYGATIYHWVDKSGTQNFTDDPEKVPLAYRNQVQQRVAEDIPEANPSVLPSVQTAAPQKEETKKDIFGIGEEWWREKARPWDEQLEEASRNYELANKEIWEESDKLIQRKYGSHQQYKSSILGMDRIRADRAKQEARIVEAEGMLKRISKDAEESKADPRWLTDASVPRQSASLYAAGINADIYGRDEIWWREKVLALREELKEAVENYEKAYENYSKNVEELGPSRFGRLSLTQYQMFSYRLDVLSNEMARYQARITVANDLLKRLLREAEESRANPEWLKQ